MNKGIIIGVVIAIVLTIGIVSVISFSNTENTVNSDNSLPVENKGKNFTISLSEDIGVEMQP